MNKIHHLVATVVQASTVLFASGDKCEISSEKCKRVLEDEKLAQNAEISPKTGEIDKKTDQGI